MYQNECQKSLKTEQANMRPDNHSSAKWERGKALEAKDMPRFEVHSQKKLLREQSDREQMQLFTLHFAYIIAPRRVGFRHKSAEQTQERLNDRKIRMLDGAVFLWGVLL